MSFVTIRDAGAGVGPDDRVARIDLLGPFRLHVAGENVVDGLGRKSQALLAFLAAEPGHRASRERLANLLWGERFDEQARQSLRQTLMALRRSFSETAPTLLQADRNEVSLDPRAFSTDLAIFEAAVDSADGGLQAQATTLWRGEFLADLDIPSPEYEEWLRGRREACRLRMVTLLTAQVRLLLDAGDGPGALLAASRLTGLDPLNEEARRLELAVVARFRGRAAAVQSYQQFAVLVRQELQTEPAAETQALLRRLDEAPDAAMALPPQVLDVTAEPLRRPRLLLAALGGALLLAAGLGVALYQQPQTVAEAVMPAPARPPYQIHVAAPEGGGVFWDDFKTRVAMLPVTALARQRAAAAFVVEGSVQAVPEGQAINLRLIDNMAGATLWADRLVVAQAERAASEAATRLFAELLLVMQRRQGALPPLSAEMKAGWEAFRGGVRRENVAEAQRAFARALAADPDDAAAKLGLAHCMAINLLNRWSAAGDSEADIAKVMTYLEQAAERIPRHILLHYTIGLAHKMRRDYPRALAAWQVGLAIDPRDGATHAQIAHVNLLMGNVQASMHQSELAIRLSPQSRALDRAYFYAGMARLLNGDYVEAEQHLSKAAAINGQLPDVFAWRVAALAQLGRLAEARDAYADLMRRFPTWNVDHHFLQAVDRGVMDRFTGGLAKAMAPAQASK